MHVGSKQQIFYENCNLALEDFFTRP